MTHPRMDNVLIVVDDLQASIAFLEALGMELEGRAEVGGPSVDKLIALDGTQAEIVSLRTPDGRFGIELDKFHSPAVVTPEPRIAPVNTLGIRRIMFEVDDIDAVVARLQANGGELVGEVVEYERSHRLAYVRGPEGIMVGLAQKLGSDVERLSS
jgi:catechol 2,3-dioxygenase-like lactoylglutathione lyase family enzyme